MQENPMKKSIFAYSRKAALMTLLTAVFIPNISCASVQEYADLSDAERSSLREAVVIEARAGSYENAVNVLEKLYHSDKSDLKSAYDYMTILHWAGNHRKAADIYESQDFDEAPDYVVLNIAASYYRLREYEKALELLQPLTEKENTEALKLQGQIYIKQNNTSLANNTFAKLSGSVEPEELLLIKTDTAIGLNNWQWAALLWRKALEEKELGAYPNITKETIVDKLSVAYLRIGRSQDALRILRPYISNKKATVNMLGNYIVALRNLRQYDRAVDIYKQFFDRNDNTPVFILREIAECFFQREQYKKAAEIYLYIQKIGYAGREDKFRLGYSGCLSNSYKNQGFAAYSELLSNYKSADTITRILNEAKSILQSGHLKEADALYSMLINFDVRFCKIYIADLLQEEQYQRAWSLAQKLSNIEGMQTAGLEKISTIAVNLRDYQTARENGKILAEALEEEYQYSEAAGSCKNKMQGELYAYADAYNDDDDSDSYSFGVYATQYLGDSFWGEVETARGYAREAGRSVAVDMHKIGLRHSSRKFDTLIGVNMYARSGDKKAGLRVDSLFRPDDRQNLHFSYNYAPIMDIDALEYEEGAVFVDELALKYTYNFNQKESAYAELRLYDYDFDNEKKGWLIGHDLQIYNDYTNGRGLRRSIHWSRDRYSNQYVPYTSPELQESIGISWDWEQRLGYYNTLHHILGVNWERDYPDPLSLNPFYRIEFHRTMTKHQYLSIGFGYGLEAESWLGEGSWTYKNNNFDISYNVTW